MSNRPDYIECIEYSTVFQPERKTWCRGDYPPLFVSIDHAALNGEKNGRLVA